MDEFSENSSVERISPREARTEDEFKGALALRAVEVRNETTDADSCVKSAENLSNNYGRTELMQRRQALEQSVCNAAEMYKSAVLGKECEHMTVEEKEACLASRESLWEHKVAQVEIVDMALARKDDLGLFERITDTQEDKTTGDAACAEGAQDLNVTHEQLEAKSDGFDSVRIASLNSVDEIRAEIPADEFRQRLREHMITEMEKTGETDFSHWSEQSPEDKLKSLQAVADAETGIHIDRIASPKVEVAKSDDLPPGVLGETTGTNAIKISDGVLANEDPRVAANVLFHESRHVDQKTEASRLGIEPMSKESVERMEFNTIRAQREKTGNNSWYQDNYQDLFVEADAGAAGIRGANALGSALEKLSESKVGSGEAKDGKEVVSESKSEVGRGHGLLDALTPLSKGEVVHRIGESVDERPSSSEEMPRPVLKPGETGMADNNKVDEYLAEAIARKRWYDKQNNP